MTLINYLTMQGQRLWDFATTPLVKHTPEYQRLEENLVETQEQAAMQIALNEMHVGQKQQVLTILEETVKNTSSELGREKIETGRLTGQVLSLENRIKIDERDRAREKVVYIDQIEAQKLSIRRLESERGSVQERYMEIFDDNTDKQELIVGLFSRMRALETLASTAYKSVIEEAISHKRRKRKDSLAIAITPEGEMIKILNLSKQAKINLGYDSDSLEGRRFTDFLNEEDTRLYVDAIKELTQRRSLAGFSLDIGLRKSNKLLTPYVLRTEAERSGDSERDLELITLFLDKPEFGRQTYNEGATEIVVRSGLSPEKLKQLGDCLKDKNLINSAKSGAAYRIKFRGTQTLSQPIIHRLGTLLASGEKVTMVGLENLGDVGYNSFRDSGLEVPRERIGLRPPQYLTQRSLDISQKKDSNFEISPV